MHGTVCMNKKYAVNNKYSTTKAAEKKIVYKKLHFSWRALANVTVEYIFSHLLMHLSMHLDHDALYWIAFAVVCLLYTFFHADFLTTLTEWPHYVCNFPSFLPIWRSLFLLLAAHAHNLSFAIRIFLLLSLLSGLLLFVCIFANFAANFIYCCKTAFFFFVVVVAAAVTSHILFIYVNCYCVSFLWASSRLTTATAAAPKTTSATTTTKTASNVTAAAATAPTKE